MGTFGCNCHSYFKDFTALFVCFCNSLYILAVAAPLIPIIGILRVGNEEDHVIQGKLPVASEGLIYFLAAYLRDGDSPKSLETYPTSYPRLLSLPKLDRSFIGKQYTTMSLSTMRHYALMQLSSTLKPSNIFSAVKCRTNIRVILVHSK